MTESRPRLLFSLARLRAALPFAALALLFACGAAPPEAVDLPAPVAAATAPGEPLPCQAPAGPLGVSLIRPAGAPVAVAIVDVGAQPWDRWGDTPSHAYGHYRALGQGLAAGGVAAVLYDKRGTGESPGAMGDVAARVADSEAVGACVAAALPGLPQIRVGHSMGSVVVSQLGAARAGTVLLSPVLPKAAWPEGPVLALHGERDGPGEGEIVAGADHLLMRDGALAPEVVAKILEWIKTLDLK